eukprot:145662-Hanusia_phi.AAC.1
MVVKMVVVVIEMRMRRRRRRRRRMRHSDFFCRKRFDAHTQIALMSCKIDSWLMVVGCRYLWVT